MRMVECNATMKEIDDFIDVTYQFEGNKIYALGYFAALLWIGLLSV